MQKEGENIGAERWKSEHGRQHGGVGWCSCCGKAFVDEREEVVRPAAGRWSVVVRCYAAEARPSSMPANVSSPRCRCHTALGVELVAPRIRAALYRPRSWRAAPAASARRRGSAMLRMRNASSDAAQAPMPRNACVRDASASTWECRLALWHLLRRRPMAAFFRDLGAFALLRP
jgi:hypothetical protein